MDNIFTISEYRGYYDIEWEIYTGISKIHVYNVNRKEIYNVIENNYNIKGYCSCLIDVGYISFNQFFSLGNN